MSGIHSSAGDRFPASNVILANGSSLQQVLDGSQSNAVSITERSTFIDYIESGCKLTPNGMGIKKGEGVFNISGTRYESDIMDISLSARMAYLIYLKQGAIPTLEKVEAKLPEADVNTIVRYDFKDWDGTSPIVNSAVGANGNTIAVANPLTKTGTVNRVDGHVGFAGQGDGNTGYFTSANSTGFPLNSEKEWCVLFTPKTLTAGIRDIIMFGTGTGMTQLYTNGTRLQISNGSVLDSSFDVINGNLYLITISYDGNLLRILVNGNIIYSSIQPSGVTSTNLYIFRHSGVAQEYNDGIVHYIELRNKVRTPAQIAQISNDLLLPCSYPSDGLLIPQMTSNTSSSVCSVSATNELSPYLAYRAVDGIPDGTNGCIMTGTTNQIWTIDFLGVSKKVSKISIMATTTEVDRYPKNFNIEGWNGSAWVVVGTFTNVTGWTANIQRDFSIIVDSYTKYRVNVLNNNGNASYTEIGYIQMYAEPSTTDIRSILPANSISLGYIKTNSAGVVEVDSRSYKYGRREGAVGGNRREFLGWTYVTSSVVPIGVPNPLGTEKIKITQYFKKNLLDTRTTQLLPTYSGIGMGSVKEINSQSIILNQNASNIVMANSSYTNTTESTGYVGTYAEVIE